jgi:hypothetical protein
MSATLRSVSLELAAFGVPHRVSDRDGAALRVSQQREPVDACRIDHRRDIIDPGVERYIGNVPIGQAGAARIVTYQLVLS